MTNQEKKIIAQERKKIKAFLQSMRTENNTISQELAGMVRQIGRIRQAQVGINLLLEEFEKKLGK